MNTGPLIIRTLIDKANEHHLDLQLVFVDYGKAFDSVKMWSIEKTMNNKKETLQH